MKTMILLFMALSTVWAQKDDELVTVPKKYVSRDAFTETGQNAKTEAQSNAEKLFQYVGLGREVGVAVHEGLSAVAGDINTFAGTPVGKFTLFMIAFKIVGDRAIHLIIGIPMYFVVMGIWFYLYQRLFGGKMVVVKEDYDEATKKRTKTYARDKGYPWAGDDSKNGAGIFMGGFALLFTGIMVLGIIL